MMIIYLKQNKATQTPQLFLFAGLDGSVAWLMSLKKDSFLSLWW